MRRRKLLSLIGLGIVGLVAMAFGVMPCDPDFCEKTCPICTKARQGNRFAQFLQRAEMLVTFGGCPWGRARQKKYGVRPDELIPVDAKAPG